MIKTKRKTALMRAFDFTEDDLEANRKHRLSDQQRRKLRRGDAGRVIWYCAYLTFNLLTLVAIMWDVYHRGWNREHLLALGTGLVLFGIVPLIVLADRFFPPEHSDDGKELMIQGEVRREETVFRPPSMVRSPIVHFYTVQIGTVRFHVRWREYLALKEGLLYRIYYIPDTRERAQSSFRIIAVESLSKV
jgi:hypothetical protein